MCFIWYSCLLCCRLAGHKGVLLSGQPVLFHWSMYVFLCQQHDDVLATRRKKTYTLKAIKHWWEFSGSPVLGLRAFTAGSPGSTPGLETRFLQVAWCGKGKKKKKKPKHPGKSLDVSCSQISGLLYKEQLIIFLAELKLFQLV